MNFLRYLTVFLGILAFFAIAGSASAQSDPFGSIDRIYADSVEAGPGENVSIGFYLENDENIGSISVPITYDPSLLTLTSIDYSGSRVDYIDTKIINPADPQNINGHFVVAIIQISEQPLPAGDGLLFTAKFQIAESAQKGVITNLDTLFYPPGGELLLSSSDDASSIYPIFEMGKVMVSEKNRAPSFVALDDQTILEGDTLSISVTVSDADQDSVALAVTSKPNGAVFTDNGDGTGTLKWCPDFVGPFSSDGSPFTISFWASDGIISTEHSIDVGVLNKNRAPEITVTDQIEIDAGKELRFPVTAFDPDFESIVWTWNTNLPNAEFNNNNSGEFVWLSEITDSGSAVVTFIANDPHGFSDTANVNVTINPTAVYSIELDTVEVFLGDLLEYNVFIDNLLPVTGFNILFNYDPTAFTVQAVTNSATRSEDFEYFNVTLDEGLIPGNVRLVGLNDLGSGTIAPLPAGFGSIAKFTMRASSDVALSGLTIPTRFRFLDAPTNDDNSLSDSIGLKIVQEDIEYKDGFIRMTDIGQVNRGDINLNGIAAEIADVVYFTNFFINPIKYTFNPLQYANSDVNNDNIVASIADLIKLINLVVQGASKPTLNEDIEVIVSTSSRNNETIVSYDTDVSLGGFLITLSNDVDIESITIKNLQSEMTMEYGQTDNITTIILYSLQGGTMPAGTHDLVTIEGLDEVTVESIDLSSVDGQAVSSILGKITDELPSSYELHQNYPNPFNPQTNISFDLPTEAHVQLTIYNVLGQEVRSLLDKKVTSGNHVVTWDGKDSQGESVSSGVYLYRFVAESAQSQKKVVLSRKMMLLK